MARVAKREFRVVFEARIFRVFVSCWLAEWNLAVSNYRL